ncbi:MAG: esterase-like activity of phytase family protein [Pseudomonadota bacterium]
MIWFYREPWISWTIITCGILTGLAVTGLAKDERPSLASAEPIDVQLTPLPINPTDPAQTKVGLLRYRGGGELKSDFKGFGGISGIDLSADGTRFIAVSDRGLWLTGRVIRNETGRISRIEDARMSSIRGENGAALEGKRSADAEAVRLYAFPEPTVLVSFEREHRILRFSIENADFASVFAASGALVSPPDHLDKQRDNGGLEALATGADGTIILISESDGPRKGIARAWRRTAAGVWEEGSYPPPAGYRATDAAFVSPTELIVINRRYTPLSGVSAIVTAVGVGSLFDEAPSGNARPSSGPTELALLKPPLQVDNLEAADVWIAPDGKRILTILSDDNFNSIQRTLWLEFELPDRF